MYKTLKCCVSLVLPSCCRVALDNQAFAPHANRQETMLNLPSPTYECLARAQVLTKVTTVRLVTLALFKRQADQMLSILRQTIPECDTLRRPKLFLGETSPRRPLAGLAS